MAEAYTRTERDWKPNTKARVVADFLSRMIKVLPPLHELARNAGLDLPAYRGELQREAQRQEGAVKPAARADEGEASEKRPPAQSKPPSP